MVDGRRLIRIEASAFPRIGITDFEHIKVSWVGSKIQNRIDCLHYLFSFCESERERERMCVCVS